MTSLVGVVVVVLGAVVLMTSCAKEEPSVELSAPDSLCVEAAERMERGDTLGAEKLYRRALKIDSMHSAAAFGLARIGYAAEKYQPAATLMQQALAGDPDNHEIAYRLGITFERLENPDSAAAYLRRAIELEPSFARAHYSFGLWWLNYQEPDSAVKYLESYLVLNPPDTQSVREVRELIESIHYER